MNVDFKIKIYFQFQQIVHERIALLQNILADLKESSTNETKSTAGDKHETALAMLQIEQKNIRGQLDDALNLKAELFKITPELTTEKIIRGTLVITNRGNFFVSAATSVSPGSPLGEKIMGLKAGEEATVNGNVFLIREII